MSTWSVDKRQGPMLSKNAAHHFVTDISLNDDLIVSRGCLADTGTGRKLAGHHLRRFLEIDTEQVEALDMRSVFPLRPL